MKLHKLQNICFCLDRLYWEDDTPNELRDELEKISKKLWELYNNELRNYKQK